MLRPVGNLERFSTARHSLGYYHCVASTARYTIGVGLDDLKSVLEVAVAKVALQLPPLCCGVINEDKNDPVFVRLESIDISQCIEYHKVAASTAEEYGQALLDLTLYRHGQRWSDLHRRPGWKLSIVQNEGHGSSQGLVFDAIFTFHHAFMDGISGMVFHRNLMNALNGGEDSAYLVDHILRVPETTTLIPSIESLINFKISWLYMIRCLWEEFRPRWLFPQPSPPWTAEPCLPAHVERYVTKAKLIELPLTEVSNILAACREQKATLTGLLHGTIVATLAELVPDAPAFTSSTPYSLRFLTGLSRTKEVGMQISELSSRYNLDTLSRLRNTKDPSRTTELIWGIARKFNTDMKEELSRLPNDNIVGMLPYVSNIHNLFTNRMGNARQHTYEVSNVGVLGNEEAHGPWKVERVVFTQSASVTGAAIGFNVASVADGPMVISITWLQGVVDDALVKEVISRVRFVLRSVGTGKEALTGPL